MEAWLMKYYNWIAAWLFLTLAMMVAFLVGHVVIGDWMDIIAPSLGGATPFIIATSVSIIWCIKEASDWLRRKLRKDD